MSQQAMLAETITAMKKAMARQDDASDSDNSIKKQSNRGNKLKRKAKHVSEGRLDQANGPRIYKRKINFNGHSRHVISRIPLRVDPDGDTVDDEDDESNPDVEPAEEDPYSGIHIDKILMPLTSAAELDKHPSMSIPYRSKILESMVQNAQDMVFREQASLWRMQDILTTFRGDRPWAPCGLYETENDALLLRHVDPESFAANPLSTEPEPAPASSNVNWDTMSNVRLVAGLEDAAENGAVDSTKAETEAVEKMEGIETHDAAYEATVQVHDQPMKDAQDSTNVNGNEASKDTEVTQTKDQSSSEKTEQSRNAAEGAESKEQETNATEQAKRSDGSTVDQAPDHSAPKDLNDQPRPYHEKLKPPALTTDSSAPEQPNGANSQPPPKKYTTDQAVPSPQTDEPVSPSSAPQPHRMTTRARAQATATNTDSNGVSPTPLHLQSSQNPLIHPFFLPPPSSYLDRNAGLPPQLADELRRTLTSYVQKQEEIVRQCCELLDGLRKALRLRKEVWQWCRAEAHVGEMSDGEDWIDEEEWGLDGPLRKGEDVDNGDEEDLAVSGAASGMAAGAAAAAGGRMGGANLAGGGGGASARGSGREFMTRDGHAKKTRNNRRAAAAG